MSDPASARLRQVAVVASDRAPVALALRRGLGVGEPFDDPGIVEFGLHNAVFAVGDTFVEVVAPVEDGTAAGRHLRRLGGAGGYMALFQVPDMAEARRRVADLGVRIVWQGDFGDMSGTHLHPGDVPAAIVSLDWADPPGSWRWGGPAWTGRVPSHEPGGIVALTVTAAEPRRAADRWAAVLGLHAASDDRGAVVDLDSGRQQLRFVAGSLVPDRITAVTVARPQGASGVPCGGVFGGVRFDVVDAAER